MSDITTLMMAASGGVAGDYQISRSLRLNSADSANLSRTPASASNRKTWTWSAWVKRSALGTDQRIFSYYPSASPNDQTQIRFNSDNTLLFYSQDNLVTTFNLTTTQVFRDVSAWQHIQVSLDTTQATSSNRIKIYVNGIQITAFGTETYPSQNYDAWINNNASHSIGSAQPTTSEYFNGYLADIHFIDGQALTPSSFGETDAVTGVWKPIAYAGTYGTNGFHLPFSDNTSTTTLGYDAAGSNDWTLNNFSVAAGAGNDSLVDSPTRYGTDTGAGGEVRGNYCTLNPLGSLGTTFTNGNLQANVGAANTYYTTGTMAVSSGKWYWEYTISTDPNWCMAGIVDPNSSSKLYTAASFYGVYMNTGQKSHAGVNTAYTTFAANDLIGVALDLDGGTITFYKNGVSLGTAFSGLSGTFTPVFSNAYTNAFDLVTNFGQRPFAYTAPSGFKALVTTNLPDPTVVQGDDYFNTVTWTGTGGARTITGVGFQPDWVWAKGRSGSATYPNLIWDAVRGTNLNFVTNGTGAEFNAATGSSNGGLGTSASDGFTIVSGTATADNLNASSPASTYVAWAWKANGAGSSNTDGTISSTVSANTTAGISIVTYTGTGSAATVGHGLGAVPRMIIVKNRDQADAWQVFHAANTANPETDYLVLDTTAATADAADRWNDTLPTSTVFSIGNGVEVNTNTEDYVAYCFAEVEGFSKFGSYTGNGSTDGPFVYLGFRPAVLILKKSSNIGNWFIIDSTRDPYNYTIKRLFPDLNAAESDSEAESTYGIDFNSNGFKVRASHTSTNLSGETYIFACFAENPFKNSLAR